MALVAVPPPVWAGPVTWVLPLTSERGWIHLSDVVQVPSPIEGQGDKRYLHLSAVLPLRSRQDVVEKSGVFLVR